MWANSSNINSSRINKERGGRGDQHTCSETKTAYHDAPLYALSGAQPTSNIPDGWLRAIDEALVVAHIGVANESDTYEQAKAKLDSLIGFHVDVATDPAVNGGWKLVPTAESRHPGIYKMLGALHTVDDTPGASEWESYAAFLAAAPEANT